jgi:hypothetical protein
MVPGRAGRGVVRLPWMLIAAARSRPDRAKVSAAIPPKQYPKTASRPSVSGRSCASPASPRPTSRPGRLAAR